MLLLPPAPLLPPARLNLNHCSTALCPRLFLPSPHSPLPSAHYPLCPRVGSKRVIEAYVAEVVSAIRWLQEVDHTATHPAFTLAEKISCFERCSVCLGHTALCLSGGGSLAMYHMGVVKALIECDALPTIISGTSGGSIVAGMLAFKTNQEMISEVITEDIAIRYLPARWFPPLLDQLFNFLREGCLVTSEGFEACTRAYYGTVTFQVSSLLPPLPSQAFASHCSRHRFHLSHFSALPPPTSHLSPLASRLPPLISRPLHFAGGL